MDWRENPRRSNFRSTELLLRISSNTIFIMDPPIYWSYKSFGSYSLPFSFSLLLFYSIFSELIKFWACLQSIHI